MLFSHLTVLNNSNVIGSLLLEPNGPQFHVQLKEIYVIIQVIKKPPLLEIARENIANTLYNKSDSGFLKVASFQSFSEMNKHYS